MQTDSTENLKLDITLLSCEYSQYEQHPENYLLPMMQMSSPWSDLPPPHLHSFLRSISKSYNPIPYHNLTHAFDVMTNLDQYLTRYGWQQKLAIQQQKRTLMLLAAYAHDSGHEGLTNSYYKNAKHPWAEQSSSPLQNMHAGNLRRLLRESNITLPAKDLEFITEMILKTDNFYHGWLLQKINQLALLSEEEIQQEEHVLSASCLLLHAADLNNTTKDISIAIKWTEQLYIEFERQRVKEEAEGLPLCDMKISSRIDFVDSNLSFLDHMIVPLFKGISQLENKFQLLFLKIEGNREFWLKEKKEEEKRALEGVTGG